MLFSIILPIYNEQSNIPALYARLIAMTKTLPELNFEFIFVDDGSTDDSALLLQDLDVKLIQLSRNFGHQSAMTAGLDRAKGDILITMDSDLQDPPEVIPKMITQWANGFDVVYGTRESREGETWFKEKSAALYYRLMHWMGVDLPADTGDFRLITREVADALNGMLEKRRFLRGMVPWLGFRQTNVYYDRGARLAGETHYSLRKMCSLAMDGLFSFSNVPPKIAFVLAFVALVFRQWDTTMVLVSLGVLSEYALRIYDEVRQRPTYIKKGMEQ